MQRRTFLKTASLVSTAFVIGFYIPEKSRATTSQNSRKLEPNAFIEIDSENNVNFIIGQVEMGQGIYTTLAMCIAEELNVNWDEVNFKAASVTPAFNHVWAPIMSTGGSSSIKSKQLEMRKIGASLNEMIKIAAAKRWNISTQDIKTKNSKAVNKITKEKFTFGDLVADLSLLEVPQDVKIKALKDCKIIGQATPRHPKEALAKVSGKAGFGIDVRVEGMRYAAVLHPSIFGAKVKSFDASKAKKRKGVIKVKEIPTGIAVIATQWYIAKEALKDLEVVWNEGNFAKISSKDIDNEYAELMKKPGAVMRKDGDSQKAFKEATHVIDLDYDFPFLAHAPMEPLGFVAHHEKDKATVWSTTQSQTSAMAATIKVFGIKAENVTYNTPFLGGSFGRRGAINLDFTLEGLFVAKDEGYPIMTLWTREDDIKIGNYRPKYKNNVKMALDKEGNITAFDAKVVSQSIFKGSMFEGFGFRNGVDLAQSEGLSNHPYNINNHNMQAYVTNSPIPVLWWRSVGHTQSAQTLECSIDQAAAIAKKDPIEYRKSILKNKRFINLLDDVAKQSNWKNKKQEKNVGYGVAIVESFGTICAQVAKVRVNKNDFKVEKVWCSVDCGFAFNPQNVENQMIGGINYGLATLLRSEITIENGATVQSNFYDYEVNRMSDTPIIKVSIINSGEKIGGIGEPGTPPILAAVPNAIFNATGKLYTSMPIKMS
jgi:isoquinoline 1-oxidoreductase beta subunit